MLTKPGLPVDYVLPVDASSDFVLRPGRTFRLRGVFEIREFPRAGTTARLRFTWLLPPKRRQALDARRRR